MYLQIFLVLAVLQLTIASHPIIFQEDNSVIASEPAKSSLIHQHDIVPVHYPYYEVITNQPAESPSQPDSLPEDLIEIASTRLGIKNLDEIPSISELGELLGTTSREETIEAIRHLTATESGIDLIKAFIEASDYTDSTAEKAPKYYEADTSEPSLPTSLLSETAQKDLEILKTVLTTPKPELGFFQRVSSYFNMLDFFPNNKEIPIAPVNKEVQQLKAKTQKNDHEYRHQRHPKLQPNLPSGSLPDAFPIPIMSRADNPYLSSRSRLSNPMTENSFSQDPYTTNPFLRSRFNKQ